MNRSRLLDQLVYDEGEKLSVYQDSEGFWTIGVGRLVDGRRGGGISEAESRHLLNNDVDKVLEQAKSFWWFEQLNDVRQEVILNMIFNLGLGARVGGTDAHPVYSGFKGFGQMIRALEQSDYEWAAQESLDSKWATQVGNRALRLAEALRRGEW